MHAARIDLRVLRLFLHRPERVGLIEIAMIRRGGAARHTVGGDTASRGNG